MSLWWGIKGCRFVSENEARKILSAFAHSICFDNYEFAIWQNEKTGLYTLVKERDHGFNGIERILSQELTEEQLEKKLCSFCPFYYESG